MFEAGHTSHGAPIQKKYQVGEALANGGVPLSASVLINVDGVKLFTTTAGLMAIGLGLDVAATRNTAQQSDGSDPASYVTVSIRPDLIVGSTLSGGATSGTVLTELVNTTADTTGLLLTFAASQAAYDDGYMWGATGANAGKIRKIIALTTTGTPIIAFPQDIAAGDIFYAATFGKGERSGVQLTSDVTQIDASGDNQAGNNFHCYDFFQKAKGAGGATKSEAHLVFCEHAYRFSGTAAS